MSNLLYAHIPGLRIDQPEIACAEGRLIKLPFEKWMELESDFEYADSKYDKVEPVFWTRALDVPPDASEQGLITAVNDAVWPLHTAFLLDNKAPLMPTPQLSCLYIHQPAQPGFSDSLMGGTVRLIGPMEREFVVYGAPLTYAYGADGLAAVEALHDLLVKTGAREWEDEIRAGIETLEETARPDSWYGSDQACSLLHGFVRCMAATENILLPPEEMREDLELGLTFARHASMLLADTVESKEQAVKYFADLYRFRSELMHGRSLPDQEDPVVAEKLRQGRLFLRYVLCIALVLRRSDPATAPLWLTLQESWKDPERLGIFLRTVREGVAA